MQLSPSQKEAIDEIDRNLQIIACAGAGKTEVITRRIVNILDRKEDVLPDNIVAFTFTEKAAQNMRTRIERVYSGEKWEALDGIFIGTIHSFCRKILCDFGDEYKDFEILDMVKEHLFVERYYKECAIESLGLNPDRDAKLFVTCFEKLIDDYKNIDLWEEKDREVFDTYRQCLIDHGYIDFALLIHEAVKLIEENPDVLNRISNIKYLVVDEYQDVDDLQEKLIALIASAGANICVVGDDDQTIYQFRGSNANNIIGFYERYANVHQVRLETNYRCGQAIVDVASTVIEKNQNRLEKKMTSGVSDPGCVEVGDFDSQRDEYKAIAKKISEAHKTSGKYSDIAILLRKRKVMDKICHQLADANIPYYCDSTDSFFEGEYYKLLGSIVEFIHSPSKEDLYEAWKDYLSDDLFVTGFKILRRSIRSGGNADRISLSRLVTEYLSAVGFLDDEMPDVDIRRRDLKCFLVILSDIDSIYGDQQLTARSAKASKFVERDAADEYVRFPIEENQEDAVQIMTVHKSKGLEYETVFIPDLKKGMFPSRKVGGKQYWHVLGEHFVKERKKYDATIEDERKLFYVAATRARQSLYLYFDTEKENVSPFVVEACDSRYVQYNIEKILSEQRKAQSSNVSFYGSSYGRNWFEKSIGDSEDMGRDEETITIDYSRLEKDMLNDSMGAYFGGGFGGALMEAESIKRASPEEVVDMAIRKGIDLRKYQM